MGPIPLRERIVERDLARPQPDIEIAAIGLAASDFDVLIGDHAHMFSGRGFQR